MTIQIIDDQEELECGYTYKLVAANGRLLQYGATVMARLDWCEAMAYLESYNDGADWAYDDAVMLYNERTGEVVALSSANK